MKSLIVQVHDNFKFVYMRIIYEKVARTAIKNVVKSGKFVKFVLHSIYKIYCFMRYFYRALPLIR